jgi:hypothetical protein
MKSYLNPFIIGQEKQEETNDNSEDKSDEGKHRQINNEVMLS